MSVQGKLQVQDWMTGDPVFVSAGATLLEAFERMVDRGIRHLPVLDGERQVVGVLSIDDLRGALPYDVSPKRALGPVERHDLLESTVAGAMTWVPQTARPDEPLAEAARRLADARIGCLPVVDEHERLVGMFSETDALYALHAELQGKAAEAAPADATGGLVDALWSERERLVRSLGRWQGEERVLSADLREEPRDGVDRAFDEREVAHLDRLSERASRRLRAIEAALERAERGELGVCERCGGRIPVNRLRAIPEATLCVRCARREAGQGAAGER